MCTRCVGNNTNLETVVPKDELWELYRAAYEQYKSEIIIGNKKYLRFVNDFISFHFPCFYSDQEAVKTHYRNVIGLYELLTERLDLVESFFAKNNFTEKDYLDMHKLFNTTEKVSVKEDSLGSFDAEEISLITQTANEANIFDHDVREEEMVRLMNCTLHVPLQLTNNRRFAVLFDGLRSIGRLPNCWQKRIEEKKLIASSKTHKPICANGIASALTQAKAHPDGFNAACSTLIKKLQEMKQ